MKMLSAHFIFCIYSNALQKTFTIEANTMIPDQTASKGPYYLQYKQPKYTIEQTAMARKGLVYDKIQKKWFKGYGICLKKIKQKMVADPEGVHLNPLPVPRF